MAASRRTRLQLEPVLQLDSGEERALQPEHTHLPRFGRDRADHRRLRTRLELRQRLKRDWKPLVYDEDDEQRHTVPECRYQTNVGRSELLQRWRRLLDQLHLHSLQWMDA